MKLLKIFKTENLWTLTIITAIVLNLGSAYSFRSEFMDKKLEKLVGLRNQSQVQQFLLDSGYELPKYGVDGKCGKEMNDAWDQYNLDHNNF